MKVLLTGAGGFVGSQVARALVADGANVFALLGPDEATSRIDDVADGLRIVRGDLCDDTTLEALARIEPEVCVSAAWYANPTDYLDSPRNVDLMAATLRLALKLAKSGCRRFVGVGTCFEYDTSLGYLSERTPIAPGRVYSACKAGTWLALEQIGRTTGMATAWARLFYLYGPAEDPRRLVPIVIQSLLEGREVATTPGEQVRDFLHVSDAATALAAIARSDVEGPVNVGSGVPVTVADIVGRLASITGRTGLLKLGALPYRAGDPMFVCADPHRLVRECGWAPRFTLQSGLEDAVAWWRARTGRGSPGGGVPDRP
jgi:nucleoside-diphosphate-sugar epimerase